MMEKQTMSSVQKAICILEVLGEEPFELTAQAISQMTGINITTVYRTLYQLEEAELVSMDEETKKYRVGANLYHIGATYLNKINYVNKLTEILTRVSDESRESVGLAIRDRNKILSIVEIEVHQVLKMNDVPGRYFQGNKGNYGKCITAFCPQEYIDWYLDNHTFEKTCPATLTTKEELLAEYAKIREQGYSTSVDELAIDVIGVGIPIFNRKKEIRGCMAIAFFREDGWEQKLERMRDIGLSYQREIEKYLP